MHHAIVTGGSRGIGRAIVDRLLADGHQVLTCGRGERPADLPSEALWVQADVTSSPECNKLVTAAVDAFGTISLLVNNAGMQIEKTVLDTTDEEYEQLMSINCDGVFKMSRAVLPHMVEHGGNIVNVGSISGVVSEHGMALYSASKAFVHTLTKAIAVDHGPKVRCNAVQPGWIMTEMSEAGFAQAEDPVAAKAEALARHPAQRLGEPADVAAAVAWLASSDSSFMTGQFLMLDGGLTAGSPINPNLVDQT